MKQIVELKLVVPFSNYRTCVKYSLVSNRSLSLDDEINGDNHSLNNYQTFTPCVIEPVE